MSAIRSWGERDDAKRAEELKENPHGGSYSG